jgi:hypothetical protein
MGRIPPIFETPGKPAAFADYFGSIFAAFPQWSRVGLPMRAIFLFTNG